jgi:hypothetical protein
MIMRLNNFKTYKSGLASYHNRDLRLYYVYGKLYRLTGQKPIELGQADAYKLILRAELFN